jgi:fermentation-respiration switch protein FrsA (DUF1100 family)
VRAVVAVATFTRMRDVVPLYAARIAPTWLLPASDVSHAIDRAGTLGDFRPDDADSVLSIAATEAEVLLLHGCDDAHIPWQHGQALHDAAPLHSELVVVDGCDHDTIMRDSIAWFERWLSPRAR